MRVDVVTIFPEYLAPLELSLIGRARSTGLLDLTVHDLRSWTTDRHRRAPPAPRGPDHHDADDDRRSGTRRPRAPP